MFRKILLAVARAGAARLALCSWRRTEEASPAASTWITTRSTPRSIRARKRSPPTSRFASSALDNDISTASFELNNAFNVSRVVDDAGHQIPASRSGQDMGVRLSFPAPLVKGKPTTVTFQLRRAFDRPGRIARLRHQVRRHPERLRVSDVSGALVSGERLQRGSIHVGSPYHGTQRISGDRERPGKFASPPARRQDGLQLSIHQALVSGKHRGGARRSGESEFGRRRPRPSISGRSKTWPTRMARRPARC